MIIREELRKEIHLLLDKVIVISDEGDPIPAYTSVPVDKKWPYIVIDIPVVSNDDTKTDEGNQTLVRITAVDNSEWFEGYSRTAQIVKLADGIIKKSAESICLSDSRVIQAVFVDSNEARSGDQLSTDTIYRFDLTN